MANASVPNHVGIILDGNRRWAKQRGLPTLAGHKKGADITRVIVQSAQKMGIKILTVFAFSTENWNRPSKEVDYLMKLFLQFIKKYLPEMKKKGIKFKHLGESSKFSPAIQKALLEAEEATKNNDGIIFCMALNYGGRDDIKRAMQKIIKKGINPQDITEQTISDNMDTAGLPDPDLIIRTSGEQRLSGFLLWQSACSELYFTKKCWPAFTEKDLQEAVDDYGSRQRRFGK